MSLIFNGTSDWAYGELPSPLSTNGSGVSAYVLFRTGSTFGNVVLLATSITANGNTGTYRGFTIMTTSSGGVKVDISTSGGVWASNSLGSMLPNTTYRVVVTKASADGNFRVYLNKLDYSNISTGATQNSTAITGIVLSRAITANTYYFNGQIEDVAIWNSQLTDADINILFDPSKRPSDCSTSPFAYWPLISDDAAASASTIAIVRNGPTIASSTLITPAMLAPTSRIIGVSDYSAYTVTDFQYGAAGELVQPGFVAASNGTVYRLGIRTTFFTTNALRLTLRDSSGNLLTTGIIGRTGGGDMTCEVSPVSVVAGQTYFIGFSTQGDLYLQYSGKSAGYVNLRETTSTYDAPSASFVLSGRMTGNNTSVPPVWVEGQLTGSLDSVNSGTPLIGPGTYQWTTNNFVPNQGNINGLALRNVSAATFTIPDFIDGVAYPAYGSCTITASDGTNSDSLVVNYQMPTNRQAVMIVENEANTALFIQKYTNLDVGDIVYSNIPAALNVATNYIDTDGGIYTDYLGQQYLWKRNLSNIMTRINLRTSKLQPTQEFGSKALPNLDSPKWDWRFTAGNRPVARSVSISGSSLGTPPPVLLYMDWHYARTDEPSTLQPIIGSVMGGTTNVRTAWGRNGIIHRAGGTTEGTNDATQMTFVAPQPFKNFNVGFDMAIPAGRHFNSAANPNEIPIPAASALKQVWLFDGPPDDPSKADIVIGTWTTAAFQMLGNQSSLNMTHTSNVDFTGWNFFQGMSVAGADPFVNPGYSVAKASNSIDKTRVQIDTTTPSFGGGASDARYSHITFYGWSGSNNGNSLAMAQHAMSYLYVAGADNDSVKAQIELTNHVTYSESTKTRLFIDPNRVWTASNISFTVPWHLIQQGYTHYRVTTQNGQLFEGAL